MTALYDSAFVMRNLVYGIEDSLISTTGVVVGMSLAGIPDTTVITSGIILVLVESLSMAFGSFVSEDSFLSDATNTSPPWTQVAKYAAVMFGAYVAAGALPMLPFFAHVDQAWRWSIGLALAGLFALMLAYQRQRTRRTVTKALVLTAMAATILAASIVTGRVLKEQNLDLKNLKL